MNIPQHVMNYLGIGVCILLTLYFIIIFNTLVSLKNNVKKAFSNIDVLLKQRHDELPKLIQTCQQYMQYEKSTLEAITTARAQSMQALQAGNIKALGIAEGSLRGSLGNLFALAENYPELKANQTFIHLQDRISGLENSIADRRELYNQNVTLNNIRLEQFPDLIIGKIFGFKTFDTLEFNKEELADVSVSSSFKS
jgi:LemA protein